MISTDSNTTKFAATETGGVALRGADLCGTSVLGALTGAAGFTTAATITRLHGDANRPDPPCARGRCLR
jgi:hypothetical protein